MVVTKNGRYISMTAINMHDDVFDNLRQFQFHQDKIGEVTFNYVPKEDGISISSIPPQHQILLKFKFR